MAVVFGMCHTPYLTPGESNLTGGALRVRRPGGRLGAGWRQAVGWRGRCVYVFFLYFFFFHSLSYPYFLFVSFFFLSL